MSTGMVALRRAPLATLPRKNRRAPPAPLAPRARTFARSSRMVRSSRGNGTPTRTTARASHPARRRRAAPVVTSRRAARRRAASSARAALWSLVRMLAGTSPSEGSLTGSTTRTTVARPPPVQRATCPTTRDACREPSIPITIRRETPSRRCELFLRLRAAAIIAPFTSRSSTAVESAGRGCVLSLTLPPPQEPRWRWRWHTSLPCPVTPCRATRGAGPTPRRSTVRRSGGPAPARSDDFPAVATRRAGRTGSTWPGEDDDGDERHCGGARSWAFLPDHPEIDREHAHGEQNTFDEDAQTEPPRHERLGGIAGRTSHDIGLGRIAHESESRQRIRHEVDPQDLQREEWRRIAEQDG